VTSTPRASFREATRDAWLERQRLLTRFAEWEAKNPRKPTSQAALSGVGLLYDLLPADARSRVVDTSGVQAMHRDLAVLAGEVE
jgi:hypothetical protein